MTIVKSTGIVRKVDPLGRLVLPVELRRSLNLPAGTPIELFIDGDKIILQKYVPSNHSELLQELDEIKERAFSDDDKRRIDEILKEVLK